MKIMSYVQRAIYDGCLYLLQVFQMHQMTKRAAGGVARREW